MCISTVVLSIIFQGFSISSNIWLSVWSNDDTSHVNGTENISKRNLYLTVYGLLGFGQGKINILLKIYALHSNSNISDVRAILYFYI